MNNRQNIRLGIILFSFFLFPATFYYFSPYLIVDATAKGIVNGSFIIFLLLFISSLFLGRGFCGWVCPAAGCQEAILPARTRKVKRGDFIKWIIWIPWISAIVIAAIKSGGHREVDFLYQTKFGFSIGNVYALITYLAVLLLIVVPAFIVGRRSFCHHICWMAPFMILGRKMANAAKLPSLRLAGNPEVCINCRRCTENCPMSLPVEDMVGQRKMESTECILCGGCVDCCKRGAIKYAFGQMEKIRSKK
jgi:ferredoxin-type protein NapH